MDDNDQYGIMADLSHYTKYFSPQEDIFSGGGGHRNQPTQQQYQMNMLTGNIHHHHQQQQHHHHHDYFRSDSNTTTGSFMSETLDQMESGGGNGNGRWPRQETLTLLEIRTRLHSKFSDSIQKGPLWDEVSRIMCEEHGYQRSGKKCREKFENLYKYYKKTKEGKAGRQDGKHYRFFRQLEALYGETSNYSAPISESHLLIDHNNNNFTFNPTINTPTRELNHHASIPSSSYTEFDGSSSSSSDNNGSLVEKRKKKRSPGGRRWKAKVKEFIDVQMRKIMEMQESWMEKMTRTLEKKEEERMAREEEWRKKEEERVEREHKFWAGERAWMEARDAALMEAFRKISSTSNPSHDREDDQMVGGIQSFSTKNGDDHDNWDDCEMTRLIQLRTSLEPRFSEGLGCLEESLWEEISSKMAFLGYERSGLMCKNKWESIENYMRRGNNNCNKRVKETDQYNYQGCGYGEAIEGGHDHGTPSQARSTTTLMHDGSSFRLLLGDGDNNCWENYGVRISKGENHLS